MCKASRIISAFTFFAVSAHAASATNSWSWTAAGAIKETFDGNVYMQDSGERKRRESFVSTFSPEAGVTWKPRDLFHAGASYVGSAQLYHSESGEDHMLHRISLNLVGTAGIAKLEFANSVVMIDGSEVGPTWTEQGGAPATGGPAVRDRREALVYRNSLRATIEQGRWLARPAAAFYAHDWQTSHSTALGYQNYVDRSERTIGTDAGYKTGAALLTYAGYRYGEQKQDELLRFPEHYDNTFHRVLFGTEGAFASWLRVSLAVGPEFRRYDDSVSPDFDDRSRVNLYVDAALIATVSTNDRIHLSVKQFQQPGFSGRSAYDDRTCDVDWRHRLGTKWTLGLASRAYNTRFLRPVERNDWVFSPGAIANCAVSPQLNVEASFSYEVGRTKSSNAEGREYERPLAAIGMKYAWR